MISRVGGKAKEREDLKNQKEESKIIIIIAKIVLRKIKKK